MACRRGHLANRTSCHIILVVWEALEMLYAKALLVWTNKHTVHPKVPRVQRQTREYRGGVQGETKALLCKSYGRRRRRLHVRCRFEICPSDSFSSLRIFTLLHSNIIHTSRGYMCTHTHTHTYAHSSTQLKFSDVVQYLRIFMRQRSYHIYLPYHIVQANAQTQWTSLNVYSMICLWSGPYVYTWCNLRNYIRCGVYTASVNCLNMYMVI